MTLSASQLRKSIQNKRLSLSQSALHQREQQLFLQLIKLPEIQTAQAIAAYWPSNGEANPVKALNYWQQQGKRIYLPRMYPHHQMQFHPFSHAALLQKNRFGIKEPHSRRVVSLKNLDVVLTPLVAFDKNGNRMGMGGGYYDRAFAFMRHQSWRRKPLLIGIAHDFQQAKQLDAQAWDIPLSLIVTNQQVFRPKFIQQ